MLWLPASTAPAPDLGGTLVWLLRDADPLPAWSVPCLSDGERARADSLRHPIAHRQFVRGRAVLRSALALWLGVPPIDVPIRISSDGKPSVDSAGVHFNASHTSGFALFGISRRVIGVDIEIAEPKRDADGLVRRFFTPEEQSEYFRVAEARRPAAFLRGWTCKEALLKAIGSGVRDLQNCAVAMDADAPPVVLFAPGGVSWHLEAGEVASGVAWAVASPS